MLDQVRNVLRTDRVQDVEEVGPVWEPALCQLRGEVDYEVVRILKLRPEILHGELVKEGHLDHVDVADHHQLLQILQNGLQVIFG